MNHLIRYKLKQIGRAFFLIIATIGFVLMIARAVTGTRLGEPFTRPECCPCAKEPRP